MQRLVSGDALFHLLVSEVKSHFLLPKRFENKLDDSVSVFQIFEGNYTSSGYISQEM